MLSALATAPVHAQALPAEEPEGPRYTVEMIVFTYEEPDSGGNEVFAPKRPLPAANRPSEAPGAQAAGEPRIFGDARIPQPLAGDPDPDDLAEPEDESGSDVEEIPVRRRIEMTLHDAGQYTLSEIYEKLTRLDAYEPIMHAAWTQTTPPRDAAPALHLRALGDPPLGLDGTVRLYKGRFVHLELELSLDGDAAAAPESATDRLVRRDTRPAAGNDEGAYFEPAREPVRYRISEDRILRRDEIRYYDHPKFGVIAKLTETPEPADGPAPDSP